ncbi:MAG: universal stress protein [Myxococcales bacterium]|nr:universal stress protein [Myxococcales bacterium]MCB9580151.1 universal stress protein [Polyangiaceae bacterium]
MATLQKRLPAGPVILVGLDFSDPGDAALRQGIQMAARETGSHLHVVHVAPGSGPVVAMELSEGREELTLQQAAKSLAGYVEETMRSTPGGDHIRGALSHVRLGDPAEEITRLAVDLNADLIIVGTHGRRGLRRMILGSVAERVTRLADCPVLVARPKTHDAARQEVPEIEPPCPLCLQTRQETGGAEMWCVQHKTPRLGRRHTYHYVSRNAEAQENAPLLLGYDASAPSPQNAAKPGGHE